MKTVELSSSYDFESIFRRLSANPLMVTDLNKRLIKLPILHNGTPYVVDIVGAGTREKPLFNLDDEVFEVPGLLQKVKDILMWEVDLKPVHSHFADTDLAVIFKRFYGMPLIRDVDLFRCLITQIIHQQLNMTFAYTLTDRFVKNYGFEKEGVWFFPEPEKVAQLDPQELRELQFSMRKAEYVIGISKAVVNGELDLEALPLLPDQEVVEQLTKLRGVGHWTAQCVLLFGLGRPDVFLPADIGIQNGIKKVYQMDQKPTFEQMEVLSEPWKPYRSYASLYLWENLSGEVE